MLRIGAGSEGVESPPRGPPRTPQGWDFGAAEGPSRFCGHAAKVRANRVAALPPHFGLWSEWVCTCPVPSISSCCRLGLLPPPTCPHPRTTQPSYGSPSNRGLGSAERGGNRRPPRWALSTETSVAARSCRGGGGGELPILAQPSWILSPPVQGLCRLKLMGVGFSHFVAQNVSAETSDPSLLSLVTSGSSRALLPRPSPVMLTQ